MVTFARYLSSFVFKRWIDVKVDLIQRERFVGEVDLFFFWELV